MMNNSVFVVMKQHGEFTDILEVFDSLEKANNYINNYPNPYNINFYLYSDEWCVK